MPDYSQGKIYTLKCKSDPTLVYVGSTTLPLNVRLNIHKYGSKMSKLPVYKHIQDWDDWVLELYENFPCVCKKDLIERESQIIRQIGTLNVRIEDRTEKQYRLDTAESKKKKDKQYAIDNAEHIKAYKKQYAIDNAEHIKAYKKQYDIDNAERLKEKNKQYAIDNAERIKAYKKEYATKNAEKIKEYKKHYYQNRKLK